MPSSQWDTPFTYAKGNKEFSGDKDSQAFVCDIPGNQPSTPIESPIDNMKYKQSAPTVEDSSANLDGSLTKAPWDSPFKETYSKGSTQSHN